MDTFSVMFVSIITVWIAMCIASKWHRLLLPNVPIDARHMYGWGGSHTSHIFTYSRLQHQAMPKIYDYYFLYVSLLTPRFLKWLQRFLENVWSTAIVCMCNSSIQKNLLKWHSVFYSVCRLIAVFKIFKTFKLFVI